MKIDIRDIFESEKKSLKEAVEAEEVVEQVEEQIEESASEQVAEPETEDEPEKNEEGVEHEEPEDQLEEDDSSESEEELVEEAEPADEPEEISCSDPETIDKPGFWKLYGSLVAIAAAFVVLLVGMFAYTNLIPRQVSAIIDGQPQDITTYEHTVAGFLTEQGIPYYEEDYLSTPPTGFIHDGMDFEILHATDFEVTADGETKAYKSLKPTVEEAIADVGIKLRDRDIVIPKRGTELKQDSQIVVKRVEIEKKTVTEKVKFKTIEKDDTTMAEGKTKVLKEGKNGKDKVTYEITYIDGKEAKRKELKRKVIEKPVNKVVANGTQIEYNGKLYSRKLVVKAYSYTGGGTTAMGTRARVGEIAVDPSVIPLGTNVYIEGVGARRAEDTGGNIKGNTIDIYMNTLSECRQ
ncbi:MAG: G5 domain-containing protein, partial [Firmicutes bacterium]|nr:G5 domain-containing protein [Bacillota bacterium]